jgi:putative flippase GtrA
LYITSVDRASDLLPGRPSIEESVEIRVTVLSLAAKYALFAAIAAVANVATQYLSLSVYSKIYGLYMAMAFGTLAGLVLKYILDREYIFYYRVENRMDDMRKFILYSLMGVLTTMIFWAFELGFNAMFKNASAKYIGATLGLAIGYTTKYHLDKRFVFKQKHNKRATGFEES